MTRRVALGILGGGVVGFAIGAAVYVLVNPMLEDASGWVRETQGLLWNLVPFLTVLGALAGGLLLNLLERPRPRP
ncbi:MAG: hypothetical protein WEG56_02930 [Chloroflexota bacterium]